MSIYYKGRRYAVAVVNGRIYIDTHPVENWPLGLREAAEKAVEGKCAAPK